MRKIKIFKNEEKMCYFFCFRLKRKKCNFQHFERNVFLIEKFSGGSVEAKNLKCLATKNLTKIVFEKKFNIEKVYLSLSLSHSISFSLFLSLSLSVLLSFRLSLSLSLALSLSLSLLFSLFYPPPLTYNSMFILQIWKISSLSNLESE